MRKCEIRKKKPNKSDSFPSNLFKIRSFSNLVNIKIFLKLKIEGTKLQKKFFQI